MNEFMNKLLGSKRGLFVVAGALGGLLSGVLFVLLSLDENEFTSWVLSGALDAALISALIICGQVLYQTKKMAEFEKLNSAMRVGSLIGAGGGLVALVAMNVLSQGELGRIIGWAISGGAAGFVVSRQVPNMNKMHAIGAGAVGGAVGCIAMAFDFGYVVGVGITGAAIGFVVALADEMLRKSWIEVTEYSDTIKTSGINMAKVNNTYTLTLGSESVRLGYSSDMEIQLKPEGIPMEKDVAVLTMEDNKCFITYLKTGVKTELLQEQPLTINNCELKFNSK
jgi:hypothetical protein